MSRCPECGHEASEDMQFCAQCHHTMYYRCPNCWHHQQTPLTCEKCGLNMGGVLGDSGRHGPRGFGWGSGILGDSQKTQIVAMPEVGTLIATLRARHQAGWCDYIYGAFQPLGPTVRMIRVSEVITERLRCAAARILGVVLCGRSGR